MSVEGLEEVSNPPIDLVGGLDEIQLIDALDGLGGDREEATGELPVEKGNLIGRSKRRRSASKIDNARSAIGVHWAKRQKKKT